MLASSIKCGNVEDLHSSNLLKSDSQSLESPLRSSIIKLFRSLPNTEEQQADELQNLPFSSPESMSFIDGDCGGLNDEECMVRRSLAAHTDYIYTQENDVP
ncbi:hypothetical protein GQ457_15G004430 [Hibiscus cannabinus]